MDFDKRAPIHFALEEVLEEEGLDEVVKMLLDKGADPNVPSQDFVSCTHFLATK